MTIDEVIAGVIEREGGFVNDPVDRGGATKYGITINTLSRYRRNEATVAQVMALTVAEATEIYREGYVEAPGFHRVANPSIQVFLVDSGVHHGTKRPIRWLQRVLKVKVDGDFGPKSQRVFNALDDLAQIRVFLRLVSYRVRFMARIIQRDHSQARYANGWFSRAVKFLEI